MREIWLSMDSSEEGINAYMLIYREGIHLNALFETTTVIDGPILHYGYQIFRGLKEIGQFVETWKGWKQKHLV